MSDLNLVSEARTTMLSFYITDDSRLYDLARAYIEKRVQSILAGEENGVGVERARSIALSQYYELGSRYFSKYSITNWRTLFLTAKSKYNYEVILNEVGLLETKIAGLQEKARLKDLEALEEIGDLIVAKIKLERILRNIDLEMATLLESQYFREYLLAAVVREYYRRNRIEPNPFTETQITL